MIDRSRGIALAESVAGEKPSTGSCTLFELPRASLRRFRSLLKKRAYNAPPNLRASIHPHAPGRQRDDADRRSLSRVAGQTDCH